MASPQARYSIGKEAECEEFVVTIPPELPLINIPSDLPPAERPECCIYRVPKQLRKVNEEAYTPKLVSIGPFHHSRKELKDMEMHKLRYLNDFLKETGKRQEDLLKIIKDNEEKIRHCYSEDPLKIIKDNEEKINHCYSEDDWRLESNDFVQMILLDAIFIIELFLKGKKKETDCILSKPWLKTGILHDLILLENQLPFFVLEKLYIFAFNIDSSSCNHREEGKQMKEHQIDLNKEDTPFLKLSRHFFSHYDKQKESNIGGEVKHFTDFIRYLFGSIPYLIEKSTGRLDNLYSAIKLDYAGLKFKVVEDRRLIDIRFPQNAFLKYFPGFNLSWLWSVLSRLKCFRCLERMQCILEVPSLTIYDNTEALFRNVMALEQCHCPFNTYICNYVMLMHYLIKTEKDVDLLVEKKVIVNYIGSNDEVATLFNNLCIQIGEVTSCYLDLGQELKKHYEHPGNYTLAVLRNMYFGDFGRGIATVAALLTLLSIFVPFLTDIGSKRN